MDSNSIDEMMNSFGRRADANEYIVIQYLVTN